MAVEKDVADPTGRILIGEFQGIRPEPLGGHDRDLRVGQDAADRGVGSKVFEAGHPFRSLLCCISWLGGQLLGALGAVGAPSPHSCLALSADYRFTGRQGRNPRTLAAPSSAPLATGFSPLP